ncbi:PEP-CTERM sorting domain-containing protein [Derxia gummosa]|uniref:PEP-CTERM sorting domain-containing protein n=1 Tax=Derxia gummosa DSM 723 TaxID=1121388 RepID=A0A8B6X570_9BURK|nr:PEP-CTERM sorting domain-containing protein [Derxia gummosa]
MSKLRLATVATALALAYATPSFAATGFDVSGSVITTNLDVQTFVETNRDATVVSTPVSSTTTARQVVTDPKPGVAGSVATWQDTTTTYRTSTTDSYTLSSTYSTPSTGYSDILYVGNVNSYSTGSYTLDVSAILVGEYATGTGLGGRTRTYVPTLEFALNDGPYVPFSTLGTLLNSSSVTYTLTGVSYGFTLASGDMLSFSIAATTDGAGRSQIASLDIAINGSIAGPATTQTTSTLISSYTIPALPVPEPEVYTLGSLAFGLVAFARRRERRIAA